MTLPTAIESPVAATQRPMSTSDADRIWDILSATASQSQKNAEQISGLAQAVQSQHERISRLESQPSNMRGWLDTIVSAGSGCIVPLVTFAFGTGVTIFISVIGWLVWLLVNR